MKIKTDLKDVHDRNIVFYCAYAKDDDRTVLLRKVLELGADPFCKDDRGITPLLAAARSGDEVAMALLMNTPFTYKDRKVKNPSYTKPVPAKGRRGSKDMKKRRSSVTLVAQNTSSSAPRKVKGKTLFKVEGPGTTDTVSALSYSLCCVHDVALTLCVLCDIPALSCTFCWIDVLAPPCLVVFVGLV